MDEKCLALENCFHITSYRTLFKAIFYAYKLSEKSFQVTMWLQKMAMLTQNHSREQCFHSKIPHFSDRYFFISASQHEVEKN